METEEIEVTRPPARKARATLPPNLYSGSVILAEHFGVERARFKPTDDTKALLTKVYTYKGQFYTVPRVDHEPEPGYRWRFVAIRRTRNIFVAREKKSAMVISINQ